MCLFWVLLWCDWVAWYWLPTAIHWIGFSVAVVGAIYWTWSSSDRGGLRHRAITSVCFVPIWGWLTFAAFTTGWYRLGEFISAAGLAVAFVIGLCWAVWYVERKSRQLAVAAWPAGRAERSWDPFDLAAAYYHKRREKLDQSGLSVIS